MVNTINPADCDRVTVYTGECRNFQDTEWITFNSGRRRSPNARDGNTWLVDVAHGSFWMRDDQVRDLVRLVPSRPITSDDLPERLQVFTLGAYRTAYFDFQVRDALAGHLNANGGVPAGDGVEPWPEVQIGVLEYACARWRRAHEIVEGERDQARRERDEWEEKYLDTDEALHKARRERDEYRDGMHAAQRHHEKVEEHLVARAEVAEQERDEWESLYLKATFRGATPIARAEAAEACTVPAVAKAEIEKALRESTNRVFQDEAYPHMADAIWPMLSGSDPAVFVVRESDVAAVEVKRHDDGFMETPLLRGHLDEDQSMLRHPATGYLQGLVETEALARAIEAGQATDPVEQKARELWEIGRGMSVRIEFDDIAPDHRGEYLRIARHVLGQEAKR